MKIENVRLMTTEEVSNFKISLYKGNEKKEHSAKYCSENLPLLIQKHSEFKEHTINTDYAVYLSRTETFNASITTGNEIFTKVKNGGSEACVCGARLRYVDNFNFVGCSNFNDTSAKHSNYNYKDKHPVLSKEDYVLQYSCFGQNYLSKFKKWLNIEFINTTILYEFLFTIGKQIPHFEIEPEKYNTIIKSKNDSKNQELILKNLLSKKYTTILEQPHFSCKINGINTVRIPDFICSTSEEIHLIEAKAAEYLCDDDKLNLYTEILKIYVSDKDNRPIKSFHIVYQNDAIKENCITLNEFYNG